MRLGWQSIVLLLLIIAGVSGATVYFSFKGSVNVIEDYIDVSPSTFSINVAQGAHYVKKVTVKNYGNERQIYFEEVVEGPSNKAIRVSYHTEDGTSIYSSKKLQLPAGTQDNPSIVNVNVHIDVDKSATPGSYSIYVYARD